MRMIVRLAIAALVLVVAFVALHLSIVESGEVLVLRSRDAAGDAHETRLWFVSHDGAEWVAAGTPDASWLAHVEAWPVVEVATEGEPFHPVRAVPVPQARAEVLARMAEKYGAADRWVRTLFGREAVPVRLDPPGDADPDVSRPR